MARLQAVDGRVAEQQRVAVAVVGWRRARVMVFLDRVIRCVLGEVLQQPGCQHGQIARGRDVAGLGQAFRVLESGGRHTQRLGLGVHHLDKVLGRAAYALGQRHRGIVARLHDHALDQVFHRHLHLGVDEHARAGHLPGAFADRQRLRQGDFLAAQRVEHQIGRHQLGQRGRLNHGIGVLGGQHLVRRHVDQQVVTRGNFGRLQGLGKAQRHGSQQGKQQAATSAAHQSVRFHGGNSDQAL